MTTRTCARSSTLVLSANFERARPDPYASLYTITRDHGGYLYGISLGQVPDVPRRPLTRPLMKHT